MDGFFFFRALVFVTRQMQQTMYHDPIQFIDIPHLKFPGVLLDAFHADVNISRNRTVLGCRFAGLYRKSYRERITGQSIVESDYIGKSIMVQILPVYL